MSFKVTKRLTTPNSRLRLNSNITSFSDGVLTGVGFTDVTDVSYANLSAVFTISNDNTILVTRPDGAPNSGYIILTTPGTSNYTSDTSYDWSVATGVLRATTVGTSFLGNESSPIIMISPVVTGSGQTLRFEFEPGTDAFNSGKALCEIYFDNVLFTSSYADGITYPYTMSVACPSDTFQAKSRYVFESGSWDAAVIRIISEGDARFTEVMSEGHLDRSQFPSTDPWDVNMDGLDEGAAGTELSVKQWDGDSYEYFNPPWDGTEDASGPSDVYRIYTAGTSWDYTAMPGPPPNGYQLSSSFGPWTVAGGPAISLWLHQETDAPSGSYQFTIK